MSKRRGRRRTGAHVEVPDLEIMPMLNVFIAIIPLLLLSAAFVQISVIPTTLPTAGAPAVPAAAPPEAQALVVTVSVQPDAWQLDVAGAGSRRIERRGAAPTALEDALKALAAGHDGERRVRIVAGATTRYEDIIDVMDAARAAGMPDAALADGGEV